MNGISSRTAVRYYLCAPHHRGSRPPDVKDLCNNTLLTHHNVVTSILPLGDNELWTSCRDSFIRHWQLPTSASSVFGARLKSVCAGHSNWITQLRRVSTPDASASLQGSGGPDLLVSSSNDHRVILWTTTPPSLVDSSDSLPPSSPAFPPVESDGQKCFCSLPRIVRPLKVLRQHSDYVNCVDAFAGSESVLIASGGSDSNVVLTELRSFGSLKTAQSKSSAIHCSRSVTCLQLASRGRFLGYSSGCQMHLWDLRTSKTSQHMPDAHTDCIRQISLDQQATQLISAGMDAIVKVWDLRQLASPTQTISQIHRDSIWALHATADHSIFFTGDRFGKIAGFTKTSLDAPSDESTVTTGSSYNMFWSCVVNDGCSNALCTQQRWCVSSVCALNYHKDVLWAGLGDSNLLQWRLETETTDLLDTATPNASAEGTGVKSLDSSSSYRRSSSGSCSGNCPSLVLRGSPRYKQCRLLRDCRTLITQNVFNELDAWDLVQRTHIQMYNMEMDDLIKLLNRFLSAPAWCTVDVVLGMIRVSMTSDSVFSCEALTDAKNLDCKTASLVSFDISVSEDETERYQIFLWSCCFNKNLLKTNSWLFEYLHNKKQCFGSETPSCREVVVFFVPTADSELPSLLRTQYTCKRWTRVAEVAGYISSSLAKEEGRSTKMELELYCMNQKLEGHWDLGAVKDLIWKRNQIRGKAKPFEFRYKNKEQNESNTLLNKLLQYKKKI